MDEATLGMLFTFANALAIIGWVFLAVAPRHAITRAGVTVAIAALLATAYTTLLLMSLGTADGGFGSLPDVVLLFSHPHVVLVGWIHYLAFDLFVGTWITQDWAKTDRPSWWMLPVLFLTFMAGPAGLLLYLIVRGVVHKDARAAVMAPQ